jgi:hypothetical protein
MSKFIKFIKLKQEHKLLLTEAFIMLGFSRFVLLTLKFKKIAPKLGGYMRQAPEEANALQITEAREVGWAVNVMSRHTSWESKCLVQAMAAKLMLSRRKLKSTLYLGMTKDENGKLMAHAWIKSCGLTLTGDGNTEKFTVISLFGD